MRGEALRVGIAMGNETAMIQDTQLHSKFVTVLQMLLYFVIVA